MNRYTRFHVERSYLFFYFSSIKFTKNGTQNREWHNDKYDYLKYVLIRRKETCSYVNKYLIFNRISSNMYRTYSFAKFTLRKSY